MRLPILVAILLAALLAIAIGAGSILQTDRPTRQLTPGAFGACWSTPPGALAVGNPLQIPGSGVRLRLPGIPEAGVHAEAVPGAIGLGYGMRGLSYGFETAGNSVFVRTSAVGIVIADVTLARSHAPATGGARVGTDAATFVAGLSGVIGLKVVEPTAGRLGDLPAITARISSDALRTGSSPRWTHIDRPGQGSAPGDCLVDFTLPSQVTVADFDGSVVLVQVWAADEGALESWVRASSEMIQSIRLER